MKDCLFCLKPCSKPPLVPAGGLVGASNCKSLEAQLLRHFVLRKLLDIPLSRCEESLKWDDESGVPSLRVCLKCSEIVHEAWNIHHKLVTLELRLTQKKEGIKKSMLGSLKKLRKGSLESSSLENDIRRELFPEEMAARIKPKRIKQEVPSEMELDPEVEGQNTQDCYLDSLFDEDWDPDESETAAADTKSVNRRNKRKSFEQEVKTAKKRSPAKRKRSTPRKGIKEPYKCSFCPARFREPEPRQDHLVIHEESKKKGLECGICSYPARTKEELEVHKFHSHDNESKLFSRPFACGVCDFTSKKWKVLRAHATKEHPNTPEEELGPDAQLKCAICSTVYNGAPFLIKHQKNKHPEMFGVPLEPVQCQLCSELLQSRLHLQYHLKQKHKRLNTYVCDLCGKGFHQQNHLDIHKSGHGGKRDYVCHLCGSSYIYPQALTKHYQKFHPDGIQDTGEATSGDATEGFKCKYCNLKFTFKISMIRHVKTHKKTMGIQCEICSKYYFTVQALQQHMKLNHSTSDQKTPCPHCFKVFPNPQYMQTHVVKYCTMKKINEPSSLSLESAKTEGEPHLPTNI